jgi:hypothetical protein
VPRGSSEKADVRFRVFGVNCERSQPCVSLVPQKRQCSIRADPKRSETEADFRFLGERDAAIAENWRRFANQSCPVRFRSISDLELFQSAFDDEMLSLTVHNINVGRYPSGQRCQADIIPDDQLISAVSDPTFYGWAPATTSSLTTAILESWLLNHLLRETHSSMSGVTRLHAS